MGLAGTRSRVLEFGLFESRVQGFDVVEITDIREVAIRTQISTRNVKTTFWARCHQYINVYTYGLWLCVWSVIRDVGVFRHSDMLMHEDSLIKRRVAFHFSWKCTLIIRRLNCKAETPTPCALLYFKSEYCVCSGFMPYCKRNFILIVLKGICPIF